MPLGPATLSWLAVVALAVAIVALLMASSALARTARSGRHGARAPGGRSGRTSGGASGRASSRGAPRRGPLVRRRRTGPPLTPEEVSSEIDALHLDASTALRHVAVVRYDAFGDMGGHLSWSLALVDDGGDGVVLTSIHGRSDSRTYAKNLTGWQSSQQLSPEEQEAIGFARSPQ